MALTHSGPSVWSRFFGLCRRQWRAIAAICLAATAVVGPNWIHAQDQFAPPLTADPTTAPATDVGSPRSTDPLADPVVDSDAEFRAQKTRAWEREGVQYMLLEGDVSFAMGTYGFRAHQIVVRIDTERLHGRVIRHFSIYLDDARPQRGRGPVTAQAPRLLVTASTTGKVDLVTDLLLNEPAEGEAVVAEAQRRFAQHRLALGQPVLDVPADARLTTPDALAVRRRRQQEIESDLLDRSREALAEHARSGKPPTFAPGPRTGGPGAPTPGTPGAVTARTPRGRDPETEIIPSTGAVIFAADKYVIDTGPKPGEREIVVSLMGNVRVIYQSFEGRPGASLTAENAVIFVAPEVLQDVGNRKISARDVRGIYLEDNVVASYDDYNVRAPRMYYDLEQNKAVVLDAVLYTWDVKRNVPIYMRAAKLRQESADTWSAERAALTTSEFAEPHFSIATRRITFRQDKDEQGRTVAKFAANDIVPKFGKLPLFWFPGAAGEAAETVPLRDFEPGYSTNDGPTLKTSWDMFSLMGREKPAGVDLIGRADYLGQHGPAFGLELDYDRPQMFGEFETYVVAYDEGEDEIGGRNDVEFDGDTRGYGLWRHRHVLLNDWEASIEAAYVSDETFLEEFFREEAEESKPYETSLYLKKQQEDWAFTFLAKYNLQDFVEQTTTLQSPGWNVDKLPELGYYRVATPLWEDRLTYYTENRLSRMRLRPGEDDPRDRGFKQGQSLELFGIPRTTNFDDAFEASGFPSDYIGRFDTRHELDLPLKAGMIDVVPYIAGRFTGYDDDFDRFTDEEDQVRFWGQGGVRLHTSFNRTYNDADSSLLDVHRLRHIIEPSTTLFYGDTTMDPGDLPVYDPDVEAIQEGGGVRFGVRNTLQTQRGGPGRWRTVDFLVVDTDVVLRSEEDRPNYLFGPGDVEDVIPRYFDYRPEYSLGGDHFHADVMWQISDTLAAVAELIEDLEGGDLATWRTGLNMQHSPQLASFIEYVDLDPLGSRLLSFGFTYQLTRKYTLGFRHTFDVEEGTGRSLDVSLTRKLARWSLIATASFDQIDDDQSFHVRLIPDGIDPPELNPFGTGRARD